MSGFLLRGLFAIAFIGVAGAAVGSLSVTFAAIEKYGADLPDHLALRDYMPATGSVVRAADGSFLSRRATERRVFVPMDRIPALVRDAFVSAEDKNYASHIGVDFLAMARAGVSTVSGGVQSGASTITQQVAKNLLVGSERSLDRKIREAILATRMDKDIGKDRVLEIYLNEIYLGRGAYGVAEAAKTYFDKDLAALSVAEAALIAAMPKAPSAYNPVVNPRRAKERRDYVIRRLYEDRRIDRDEAVQALSTPLDVLDEIRVAEENITTVLSSGWFEEEAWRTVAPFLDEGTLLNRDVVVETTLVPSMQDAAVAALKNGIERADQALGWRGPLAQVEEGTDPLTIDPPAGFRRDETCVVTASGRSGVSCRTMTGLDVDLVAESSRWTGSSPARLLAAGDIVPVDLSGPVALLRQAPEVEGAMIVLDPSTGDVKALVGGYSRDISVFDRVTQARRQPGSSFKPIVYMAALEMGYDATSPLLDAPIVIEQGPGLEDWRPSDARTAGRGGLISVRRALEQSRNLASVRLLWDIGLDEVADTATRLGVIRQGDHLTYPAALGSLEVTPMQLALAYATIANGGYALRPRLVTQVLGLENEVVATVPSGRSGLAVDPIAAAQMMSILSGVPTRGTARAAFEGFDRYFAGKTGTTNGARDAWFAGASRNLVTVVWIGRDDNKPLASGASGGRVAATVVREFLDAVEDEVDLVAPDTPPGSTLVASDPETGLPSNGRNAIEEIVRDTLLAPEAAETAGLRVTP